MLLSDIPRLDTGLTHEQLDSIYTDPYHRLVVGGGRTHDLGVVYEQWASERRG